MRTYNKWVKTKRDENENSHPNLPREVVDRADLCRAVQPRLRDSEAWLQEDPRRVELFHRHRLRHTTQVRVTLRDFEQPRRVLILP